MFYPSSNCDKMYLLPLEGVRGVELVTYSDVINIGLPIWEGRVRSLYYLLSFCNIHTLLCWFTLHSSSVE